MTSIIANGDALDIKFADVFPSVFFFLVFLLTFPVIDL